jgi:hypothetical protein
MILAAQTVPLGIGVALSLVVIGLLTAQEVLRAAAWPAESTRMQRRIGYFARPLLVVVLAILVIRLLDLI